MLIKLLTLAILFIQACTGVDPASQTQIDISNKENITLDLELSVKNLRAEPSIMSNGDWQVTLTWEKIDNAISYTLKRGLKTGVYDDVYENVNSGLIIKNLKGDTTQYFVVIVIMNINNTQKPIASKEFTLKIPLDNYTEKPSDFILRAIAGDKKVILNWDQSQRANFYVIQSSKTQGGPYNIVLGRYTNGPFTDIGLNNNETIYYIAIAVNSIGKAVSNEVAVIPNIAPELFDPVTVSAGDKQVTLAWTASKNATKYLIKRHLLNSEDTQTFETTSTSYMDDNLQNGTSYYYTVIASNSAGSMNATEVIGTPVAPLVKPGEFTLTASPGDNVIKLTWTSSSGVGGYTLKRGSSSGIYDKTDFSPSPLSSPFIDTSVIPGQTYYYQMTASNSIGTTISNEVQVQSHICPAGNIVISNNSDVQSFNNSGCVTINGNLIANNSQVTAIVLDNLETISGDLVITENSNLVSTSLPKLLSCSQVDIEYNSLLSSVSADSLETISSDFYLSNAMLSNLNLAKLKSLGGSFASWDQTSLTSLSLPSLETVGGYFETWSDSSLTNLNTPMLKTVGDLYIQGGLFNNLSFPSLISAGSLYISETSLTSINMPVVNSIENISLTYNPLLTSFSRQGTISGYVSIEGNSSLETINLDGGISSFAFANNLTIRSNDSLTGINATNLSSVGGDFIVTDNSVLPECIIVGILANPVNIAGATNTSNNNGVGNCGRAPYQFAFLSAEVDNASVNLSWQNSVGSSSFILSRSLTSNGSFSEIYSGNSTSFLDTGLTNGTTYYYTIKAINDIGETSANQISATPSEPILGDFLFSTANSGNHSVTVSWGASTSATSYELRRGLTSNGPYTDLIYTGTTRSFLDSGLTNGVTYFYMATATSSSSSKNATTEISATPRGVCPSGDLNITDNSVVTNFNNTGCETVSGNFIVANSSATTINLPYIKTIYGVFSVTDNPASVGDISIPSLTSLGGYILVNNNTGLTSIDLHSLASLNDNFHFTNNQALTTINASSVSSIAGYILVQNSNSLSTVNLHNLQSSNGNFHIVNNPNLASIDTANFSTFGGGYFLVQSNPNLLVLEMKISSITNNLQIDNNASLQSINDPFLTHVSGYFLIANNNNLTSINLPLLNSANNNFIINDNASLLSVNNPSLTHISGYVSINNNVSLTSISLPLLSSTNDNFIISTNSSALTTIDLSSLSTVAGYLQFGSNPSLPISQINQIIAHVTAGGGIYY